MMALWGSSRARVNPWLTPKVRAARLGSRDSRPGPVFDFRSPGVEATPRSESGRISRVNLGKIATEGIDR